MKKKRLKELQLSFWKSERQRRDWRILWDAEEWSTCDLLFRIVNGKKKKKPSNLIWRRDGWKVYIKNSFSLLKLQNSRSGCFKDLMTSEILKKRWKNARDALGILQNISPGLVTFQPFILMIFDYLLSVVTICKFKRRIWYQIICQRASLKLTLQDWPSYHWISSVDPQFILEKNNQSPLSGLLLFFHPRMSSSVSIGWNQNRVPHVPSRIRIPLSCSPYCFSALCILLQMRHEKCL